MQIVVEHKHIYGQFLIYPACDKSRLLCELAGTKTLTKAAVRTIKDLGYEILVQKTMKEGVSLL